MQFLENSLNLLTQYDAIICDVWGVLHNGVDRFTEASQVLVKYRKNGGIIMLMSNAPRPSSAVWQQMFSLNVPADVADGFITSGDLTLNWLKANQKIPIYWIGAEKDKSLFAGLTINFASIETAHAILCTGLKDDSTQTPEDYRQILQQGKERKLPFICANPDLQVEKGTQIIYCAGAIARAYENLGGIVTYYGKPHAPIYNEAMDFIHKTAGKMIAKNRVLAIGDGLHTDISGASNYGLDSVLVAAGLHAKDFKPLLASGTLHTHPLLVPHAASLKAVMWRLE